MSVCLCERGARIHASPHLAYCADFRQETPVHPSLWVCRLCVIWDHYIPSPFMGRGISPLIEGGVQIFVEKKNKEMTNEYTV
jgi:hypothetical protein